VTVDIRDKVSGFWSDCQKSFPAKIESGKQESRKPELLLPAFLLS
jgi:hypothetical protein